QRIIAGPAGLGHDRRAEPVAQPRVHPGRPPLEDRREVPLTKRGGRLQKAPLREGRRPPYDGDLGGEACPDQEQADHRQGGAEFQKYHRRVANRTPAGPCPRDPETTKGWKARARPYVGGLRRFGPLTDVTRPPWGLPLPSLRPAC